MAIAGSATSKPSSLSVTTKTADTLPAGYTTTTVQPPTGLQSAKGNPSGQYNYPDRQIALTWTASGTSNVSYEVDRNGVTIGGTAGTTFTDASVAPNTSYSYTVTAVDAAYNRSVPATVVGTSASDGTQPDIRIELHAVAVSSSAISLSWVQPFDNVGVVGYDDCWISVNGTSTNVLLTPTPIVSTTYTDSGPLPATAYGYAVFAIDAAGNEGVRGTIGAVTDTAMASGEPPIDMAMNQYIPADWMDYFNNSLEASFRSSVIQGQFSIPGTISSYFLSNRADRFLPGSIFANSGTSIPTTYYAHPGVPGQLAYRDVANKNTWQPGDPVWYDANNDSQYDAGDPIVDNPNNVTLQPGMWGKKNDLFFYDAHGDAMWHSDDIAWAGDDEGVDGSTNSVLSGFRRDFAGLYTAINQLVSSQWGWNNGWTMPRLLQTIGDPLVTGTGTVADGPLHGFELAGTGTRFTQEVQVGDQIELPEWRLGNGNRDQ